MKLIADTNGLDTLAHAASLNDVRKISTTVGDTIDEYLDRWGLRAVRYEVAYPTVAERPDWLLRQLQEHRPREHDDDRARRDAAEQRLLAALGDTDETRARLKAARRRVPGPRGQRAGDRRAASRGRSDAWVSAPDAASRAGNLERAEDVFDLTVNEVIAMLRSALIAPAILRCAPRTRRRGPRGPRTAATPRHHRASDEARSMRPISVGFPTTRPGHERDGLVHDEDLRRPAVGERGELGSSESVVRRSRR